MLPSTLILLATSSVQAGKIVFQDSSSSLPRHNRRFGGVDIYPGTIWGPVEGLAPNTTTPLPVESGASCPEGAAWCSQVSNYPDEAILRAVQKQGDSVKILFPVEEKTDKEVEGLKLAPDILIDESLFGLRSALNDAEGSGELFEGSGEDAATDGEIPEDADDKGELPDDGFENICGLTTEYIMPRAAKNKDGQFRFIVNHPEGGGEQYIQLVRVARCAGAGEECGWGLMAGRQTRCQQEYLDHKLVALSEDGEELVIDTFTFPSCCTCLMNSRDMFK